MRSSRGDRFRVRASTVALTILAAAGYGLIVLFFHWQAWRAGVSFDVLRADAKRVETIVLCAWAAFYGAGRVLGAHPVFRPHYWAHLAGTPWEAGMPLPLGSVELDWRDILYGCLLAALCTLVSQGPPAAPLCAMLLAYLLPTIAAFRLTQQYRSFLAMLALLPVLPHLAFYGLWAVLVALVGLCLLSQRQLQWGWRAFPWNLAERRLAGTSAAAKPPDIGWRLNGWEPPAPLSVGLVLCVSLLAGWWLFTVAWCLPISSSGRDDRDALPTLLGVASALAAIFRGGLYCGDCWPPLSLVGRIAHRCFIIPGYDRALVAPLTMLAIGLWLPGLLLRTGLPPSLVAGITVSLLLLAGLGMGPTLRNWHLTGHYRMITIEFRNAARNSSPTYPANVLRR